jgi:hypothetical protein
MVLGEAYANAEVHRSGSGAWTPVYAAPNLAVMSISFLLEDNAAAVSDHLLYYFHVLCALSAIVFLFFLHLLCFRTFQVVWRGPRKNSLIKQFLSEVDWSGDTGKWLI